MTSPVATPLEATAFAPAAISREDVDLASVPAGPVACPECGATIVGRFCARCGEARPAPDGLRVAHLAGELFEHVTSLDFKLVRTLVALVRRPGSLTREFVAGRRSRYTRPLALYLLVSGAFFLISPHLPVRPIDPRAFITNRNPHPAVARHFDAIAARHGETRVTMAARVARSPYVGSRYSAALLVPALAAMLTLLLVGRRRLLAEHLLFAIHAQSFLLIAVGATAGSVWPVGWIAGRLGRALGVLHPTDVAVSVLAGLVVLTACVVLVGHVHTALRRVYDLGRWGAAWRTTVLLVATPFALYVGQFVLVYLVALTGLR